MTEDPSSLRTLHNRMLDTINEVRRQNAEFHEHLVRLGGPFPIEGRGRETKEDTPQGVVQDLHDIHEQLTQLVREKQDYLNRLKHI